MQYPIHFIVDVRVEPLRSAMPGSGAPRYVAKLLATILSAEALGTKDEAYMIAEKAAGAVVAGRAKTTAAETQHAQWKATTVDAEILKQKPVYAKDHVEVRLLQEN